jgi:palmitoyl-protein thioesterase
MHNLITFGSQHMGISDIPLCGRFDFLCQVARRATKAAVYGDWAQQNLIQVSDLKLGVSEADLCQAQYFRNPSAYSTYLQANRFLTSINNERVEDRNGTYARNLASLNKLVLVLFTEDRTVVPKESSWFGSEAVPEEEMQFSGQQRLGEKEMIPMRLQPLYREDWIGLRELDERGDVVLESCQGEHMQLSDCWERLVRAFVGYN